MSYSLLEVFGIELEYMIVDRQTLAVQPVTDRLIANVTGEIVNEVENERINWSNELVLHVLEFKNNTPEANLSAMLDSFQNEVKKANSELAKMNCQLMPGAMHPLMNPLAETKLWPHGNNEIYDSFNRIFNCQGHGWSNLQSMHINIAFGNDVEFGKLHSAIRWILPFIPALSSSSPVLEGHRGDSMSNRLTFYLNNQKKLPAILGLAVPEVIKSKDEYQKKVLQPMYQQIAPFDPNGILQFEWLNSRGAIPKFDQGCIEIRLADVQEAPVVDLSIANFWIKVISKIVEGVWLDNERMDRVSTSDLRKVLDNTILDAENALIEDPEILAVFNRSKSISTNELLRHIFSCLEYKTGEEVFAQTIRKLLDKGTLSTRILASVGNCDRERITATYRQLCHCLENGIFFEN